MLASLLPGLRDLRVPLATGVLWLVVLWLACYPSIPRREDSTGLIEEMYRLSDLLGPTFVIATLSFTAYVLGILTTRPTAAISHGIVRGATVAWDGFRGVTAGRGVRLSFSSEEQAYQLIAMVMSEYELRAKEVEGELDKLESSNQHPDEVAVIRQAALGSLNTIDFDEVVARMGDDVPLVATRLLASHRELFDRYDRANAEAAFRFSITPPLAALVALIAWRLDLDAWGWVLAIAGAVLAACLLLMDGVRKERDSNDAIYQAVFAGSVQFPSIEAIRAALELAGPGDAPRIVGGPQG